MVKTGSDASDKSKAVYNENLDNLYESLSLLYIKGNISGRNKFREKWPHAAQYIFDEELIDCDNDGAKDKERRSELEDMAEARCIELQSKIIELKGKSVNSGSLQFEYVGEIIDQYGLDLSLLIYSEDIIQRVRPGLLPKNVPGRKQEMSTKASDIGGENKVSSESAQEQPERSAQAPPSPDRSDDDLDDRVRPIETSASPPPPSEASSSGEEDAQDVKTNEEALPPADVQDAPVKPYIKPYIKIPETNEINIPPVVEHAKHVHEEPVVDTTQASLPLFEQPAPEQKREGSERRQINNPMENAPVNKPEIFSVLGAKKRAE